MPATGWTSATLTARQVAERLGGALEGDGALPLRGVATLEEATREELSWAATADFAPRVERTQAGVVLVPESWQTDSQRTLIRVADPDWARCEAAAWFAPPTPQIPPGLAKGARVDPTADVSGACIAPNVFVGPGARVGPRTQLHPGVYIGADAQIGADCVLWPNVVVRERCVLGDRVIVHSNSTIGADGFGYLFRNGEHRKVPQLGIVIIDDDVEIGANSAIDRARSGATHIGRGTKIDNLVQIGHNVNIGEHCILAGQAGVSGSATLGRAVVLGGQAGVADHVTIQDGAQVMGQSGVSRNLAGGATVFGTPALDYHTFIRQRTALRRVPELMEKMRDLLRRIEKLESSANDRS